MVTIYKDQKMCWHFYNFSTFNFIQRQQYLKITPKHVSCFSNYLTLQHLSYSTWQGNQHVKLKETPARDWGHRHRNLYYPNWYCRMTKIGWDVNNALCLERVMLLTCKRQLVEATNELNFIVSTLLPSSPCISCG